MKAVKTSLERPAEICGSIINKDPLATIALREWGDSLMKGDRYRTMNEVKAGIIERLARGDERPRQSKWHPGNFYPTGR